MDWSIYLYARIFNNNDTVLNANKWNQDILVQNQDVV